MSGLINNFYYGKAGKADYTPDQLPTGRVQLFFEMLRIRFSAMMGINLLYVLFCLPAIVLTAILLQFLLASASMEAGGADLLGDGLLSMYLLLMIPCMGLAGVGATGLMYVLRNWARDQHSFMMSDFKDALRGNWKSGLLVGLINGFSLFVAYICYFYYGQMINTTSIFFIIPQTLVVIVVAIWWMMNMLIFPMMVTYDMKLRQLLRNAAIMALARLPWSVLFLAGTAGIPLAVALLVPSGVLIVAGVYLLIGFSLTGLIYASYSNACFDRFLNPRIEGAQINMGLRDPSLDDEDDDETP